VTGWRLESDGVVIGFAHILLQRIKNVRGDPRNARTFRSAGQCLKKKEHHQDSKDTKGAPSRKKATRQPEKASPRRHREHREKTRRGKVIRDQGEEAARQRGKKKEYHQDAKDTKDAPRKATEKRPTTEGTEKGHRRSRDRGIEERRQQGNQATRKSFTTEAQRAQRRKAVTNSGDLDGTLVYYYDGQRMIETRDGSGNLHQQFIHGTQYIDELVMVRVKDKGDLYVHQDANWNVIGLTDLGGGLVERHVYRPYGEITIHQETSFGDRDADGDVDSTDKGTVGTTCTGTVSGSCRILDLDFDGDYDSADATLFDSLPQRNARHPGRLFTSVDQPFGHQGLLFDAEIASYQNRARQYDPAKRRFAQRDPLQYAEGLHDHSYLLANPTTRLDPSGLASVRCDCSSSLGLGGGSANASIYVVWYVSLGQVRFPSCTKIYLGSSRCSKCRVLTSALCRRAIRHECVHICQCKRDGWLAFWLNQAWEQIAYPGPGGSANYFRRPSEMEAYDLEDDIGYTWITYPSCATTSGDSDGSGEEVVFRAPSPITSH
jgi:RHS repeat-associated protein